MQVVQQAAALADQAQKSAPRMVILRVRLEVLGQMLDTRGEKRHLDFRRTAVVLGTSVGLDYFPLANGCEGHQESLTFPFPFS